MVSYPVLRMSGCTPYSLAKTKGTMPCGSAACPRPVNKTNVSQSRVMKNKSASVLCVQSIK
jgi:hypothetical protein